MVRSPSSPLPGTARLTLHEVSLASNYHGTGTSAHPPSKSSASTLFPFLKPPLFCPTPRLLIRSNRVIVHTPVESSSSQSISQQTTPSSLQRYPLLFLAWELRSRSVQNGHVLIAGRSTSQRESTIQTSIQTVASVSISFVINGPPRSQSQKVTLLAPDRHTPILSFLGVAVASAG